MSIQFVGKIKVFAVMLCLMTLVSVTGLSQTARADNSWSSLLSPLLNSVILPTVDTKIDEMGARMDRKKAHQSTTVTVDPVVSTPVEPSSSATAPAIATPAPATSGSANF